MDDCATEPVTPERSFTCSSSFAGALRLILRWGPLASCAGNKSDDLPETPHALPELFSICSDEKATTLSTVAGRSPTLWDCEDYGRLSSSCSPVRFFIYTPSEQDDVESDGGLPLQSASSSRSSSSPLTAEDDHSVCSSSPKTPYLLPLSDERDALNTGVSCSSAIQQPAARLSDLLEVDDETLQEPVSYSIDEEEVARREYSITVDRSDGTKLGLEADILDEVLRVDNIGSEGLLHDWNKANPDRRVRIGDRVTKVNGINGSGRELARKCRAMELLCITLESDVVTQDKMPHPLFLDNECFLNRAHDIAMFWFFERRDLAEQALPNFRRSRCQRIAEYPCSWPQWKAKSAAWRDIVRAARCEKIPPPGSFKFVVVSKNHEFTPVH